MNNFRLIINPGEEKRYRSSNATSVRKNDSDEKHETIDKNHGALEMMTDPPRKQAQRLKTAVH